MSDTSATDDAEVLIVDTREGSRGGVIAIPSSRLPEAIERFEARLATAEEAAEAERRRILGGTAGDVATAALAAADELSLGAVSREARERGPEAAAARTALSEINPTAQTVGTVGGALVGGLATTGVGTALGAGRAATTLARVGRGVAEGVAAGAMGGAATLEQQLAADPDAPLTAERILGTVGVSAMLGGSLGGAADLALVGAGGLGRRLLTRRAPAAQTREAMEATAERVLGREPIPGVADRMMSMMGVGDEQRIFAGRAMAMTEEGARTRRAIEAGRSSVDETTVSLRRQLDDLDQITRTTEDFGRGELKREQMRRLVRDDTVEQVFEEGVAAFQGIRGLAQQVANDGAIAGGKGLAKRMVNMLDEYEAQFVEAAARGGRDGATDALIALDKMKRALGSETDTVLSSKGLRIVGQEFEGAYEGVRRLLERDDLFGKAAEAQREINLAWSKLIPRRREFSTAFRRRTGEQQGFRALQAADSAKINSWLQSTGTARAGSADELFESFVQEQDQFLRAVNKHYTLPDDISASIGNAQRVTDELRASIAKVREEIGAANQLSDLSAALGGTVGASATGAATAAGATLGGLVAGPLGMVAGGIAGLALRPDRIIRMQAAVERAGLVFRARESSAVSGLVARLRKPGPVSSATVRRALRNSAITISAGEVADRFDRAMETLDRVSDPMALAEHVTQATAIVGDRLPDAGAQLAATSARAVGLLRRTAPPGSSPMQMLGAPTPRPSQVVSTEEMRSWLLRAEAVDDPIRVLDAAAAGVLVGEHVEALREVYPALYSSMTQTIVEEISSSDEPLAYEGRVTLSILLGLPTDASLLPEAIAAAQATHTPPESEPSGPVVTPGNARPPNLSSGVMTATQRLET